MNNNIYFVFLFQSRGIQFIVFMGFSQSLYFAYLLFQQYHEASFTIHMNLDTNILQKYKCIPICEMCYSIVLLCLGFLFSHYLLNFYSFYKYFFTLPVSFVYIVSSFLLYSLVSYLHFNLLINKYLFLLEI